MTDFQTSADLGSVFTQLWIDLGHGSLRASHPFHTPVLASLGESGPDARTVVLRAADSEERTLVCHTDLRSPKVQELRSNPGVAWLFYDRERKTQLRLRGEVELHHDDELARVRWSESTENSRQCYRAAQAPGSVIEAPITGPPLEQGFENFAVVKCRVDAIDWLYLQHEGHMRAWFKWQDDHWTSGWLAP